MVIFTRVYLKSKGVYTLLSSLQLLAQKINMVKGKLYSSIEIKKDLQNKDVYLLSNELDKLICEYQAIINNKDMINT